MKKTQITGKYYYKTLSIFGVLCDTNAEKNKIRMVTLIEDKSG